MFKIELSPIASNKDTSIGANGDVLTIDGVDIDFAPLGEGEQCDTELPLIGKAKRVDGIVSVSVLYHYDTATAEANQSTNAADYIVELTSGDLADVIVRRVVKTVDLPKIDEVPKDEPIIKTGAGNA